MKKVLIGFVLLSLVLASMVLVACGEEETTTTAASTDGTTATTAGAEPSALDVVIAAAAEEGALIWNVGGANATPEALEQGILDMFGVEIDVSCVPGDLREDIAQMALEKEAGQELSFDLVNSAPAQILKDLGAYDLHAKIDWQTLVDDAEAMGADLSFAASIVGPPIDAIIGYGDMNCFLYNTDLITDPATQLPATAAELVDPQWEGQFGYVKFGGPVVGIVRGMGLSQDDAVTFIHGLIANGGVQGKYDEVAASVSLGEYPFGLTAIKEYIAIMGDDPEAPLGFALAEDVLDVSTATFSVIEGCVNPNAATLAVLWMFSADGAAYLSEAAGYVSYLDMDTPLGMLLQAAKDANLTPVYEAEDTAGLEWALTDEGAAYETAVNDAIHSADQ